MEEKNKQIEETVSVPKIGSGAMLSAARKELGKSAEEIADELNLSVTQIRTIELDQSEGLPEPTYVRGYIRSYARLVGLNAEEVLLHYQNRNWQKSANLDEIPRGITEGDTTTNTGFFTAGKLISLMMIAGIVGFFLFSEELSEIFTSNEISQASSRDTNQEAESAISEPAMDNGTVADLLSKSPTVDSPESAIQLDDSDAVQAEENASTTVEQAQLEDFTLEPKDSKTRVRLTFTETSWVDIRDEAQNKLAYQSYSEGRVLEVGAEGVLSVLIGNAKGVQMQLNGEPYDLNQHTKGVYAKFSVGIPAE